MWSVEPAMLQSIYKKFSQVSSCADKNCQSTKKHSYEECDDKNCQSTKTLCGDKNCQSTKCVHMLRPAMPQSSYKKCSKPGVTQCHLSRNARKKIGTQPEVTRNCQDSTSKCWYSSESTNVCPDSRCYKIPSVKSKVNTRSQVQTSKCKRDTKPQP